MLIKYSNKLTINTGNYENENPFYECEYEIPSDMSMSDAYSDITKSVDYMLYSKEKEIRARKERKDPIALGHRITDGMPSVTTVISPESLDHIPNIKEHCEIGNLFDLYCKNHAQHGKLVPPIQDASKDLDQEFIKGHATKAFSDGRDVLNNLPFQLDECDIKVVNNRLKYTGEIDCVTTDNDIVDFKKTRDVAKKPLMQIKYFKQMAAYAKAWNKGTKALHIVSPDGVYSTDMVDIFYELFKIDRKNYKEAYGL